jgi:hypothetical protein
LNTRASRGADSEAGSGRQPLQAVSRCAELCRQKRTSPDSRHVASRNRETGIGRG